MESTEIWKEGVTAVIDELFSRRSVDLLPTSYPTSQQSAGRVFSMLHGQSISTPIKEFHLEKLFGINLKVVFSIQDGWEAQRKYVHFDLNSGCGFNHRMNCPGSPLAFITAAQQFTGKICGHFIDLELRAVSELRSAINGYRGLNLHCYHEDNRDFLRLKLPALVDHRDFGSILIDPNNHEFPVEELKFAASVAPKLDLFVSIGFTTIKRMRDIIPFQDAVQRIADLLSIKKHWLIRRHIGRWNWSILVGRNTNNIDAWKAQDFYKLSDPKGFEILENAITTIKEREGNPEFYLSELRRILANSGISRPESGSDGMAQLCLL